MVDAQKYKEKSVYSWLCSRLEGLAIFNGSQYENPIRIPSDVHWDIPMSPKTVCIYVYNVDCVFLQVYNSFFCDYTLKGNL